jgi:hypothetical protein
MNSIFESLLNALDAADGVIYIGWRESMAWPDGVKDKFIKLGLLKGIVAAKQLECVGCENNCFMDIESVIAKGVKRSFIICDVPEMQSQMGRISVPSEQLSRWRFSVKQLAKIVHGLLGFETEIEPLNSGAEYRLGWLEGTKGRRKVSIHTKSVVLAISGIVVPLSEILYFEGDGLKIDQFRLNEMVNSKPKSQKSYEPNQDKRTAGKAQTLEMRASWQSAYISLKKKHPTKPNTWISEQIAKLDISLDRNARTIYKDMTP